MQFEYSAKTKDLMSRLQAFMDEHIYPNEEAVGEQVDAGPTRWKPIPLVEELKPKAKAAGLWNLFLPESEYGAGLTNLVWARQNCTVLELAPEGLRDVGYRFSSQLCGQQFAVLPCKTLDHPLGIAFADIAVNAAALSAALRQLR